MTLNENRMVCYIDNTYDIYRITEWLTNCVAKKMAKGQEPDAAYLANCSTTRKILCMAAKLVTKYDGARVTREERRTVAAYYAEFVIESAKYIINA